MPFIKHLSFAVACLLITMAALADGQIKDLSKISASSSRPPLPPAPGHTGGG